MGSNVTLIPTCLHFRHVDCAKKWFERKGQNEQRCPLCNQVLKLEELRHAKSKRLALKENVNNQKEIEM